MSERLLKCKLCGGSVSSAASKCPHCGTPNFKPDDLLRTEAAEYAKSERIKSTQRDILIDGRASADGYSDAEIRAYFPEAVKITLRVRTTAPVDRTCRILVRHDFSSALNPHTGFQYNSLQNGSVLSRDYIVHPGTHYITILVEPTGLSNGRSDCQRIAVEVTKQSTCIEVRADSQRVPLTKKRVLVNTSVRVK